MEQLEITRETINELLEELIGDQYTDAWWTEPHLSFGNKAPEEIPYKTLYEYLLNIKKVLETWP